MIVLGHCAPNCIFAVCVSSDGETRRGSSLVNLTFKKPLPPSSPIYHQLKDLTFMDLHVGDDNLTCDKDWKHIDKRIRNALLRPRGFVVQGIRITPAIIERTLLLPIINPQYLQYRVLSVISSLMAHPFSSRVRYLSIHVRWDGRDQRQRID